MDIKGKITQVLPPQTGESKRNPGTTWVSQDYVMEYFEDWDNNKQYPYKICFNVHGEEKIKRFNCEYMMAQGTEVQVRLVFDANNYNGRWYNRVTAIDVRPSIDNAPTTAEEANAAGEGNTDNIPF